MALTSAQYAKMAKAVNRYVTWDLSKRKTFSAAEKSKIKRAHDALVYARRAGLTPKRIRRRAKESQSAYRRRLAQLKRDSGQAGSPLAAVAVRVAKSESARMRGGRVEVVSNLTGRRQWFIGWDPAALATDTAAEVRRVWDEAMNSGATRVRQVLGSRMRGDMEAYRDLDSFIEYIIDFVERYATVLEFVMMGVYAERGGRPKRHKTAAPPTPPRSARDAVLQAYHGLKRYPREWIRLRDLRPAISEYSRREIDAALWDLYREQNINLSPDDNSKAITRADHAAAYRLGNDDVHLILVR